jgi:transcriptional regulator with XRE-family HTH domain
MSTKKSGEKVQSGKIDRLEEHHPGAVEAIGQRVKEIRESIDGDNSQDAFSKRLSLSLSKINRIENGRRAPDLDFLLRLKNKFDFDMDWLLTGEGTGYEESAEVARQKLLTLLKSDSKFSKSVLAELGLRPASEVVRDNRIYNMLQLQRNDWMEIIKRTEASVTGASVADKTLAENSVEDYRRGVEYLDLLLSIGRDPE